MRYSALAQSGCVPSVTLDVSASNPACISTVTATAIVCCDDSEDWVPVGNGKGSYYTLGYVGQDESNPQCNVWSGSVGLVRGLNRLQAFSMQLEGMASAPISIVSNGGDGKPVLNSINCKQNLLDPFPPHTEYCGSTFTYGFACAPGNASGWYWQETVYTAPGANNCGTAAVGPDGPRDPIAMIGAAPNILIDNPPDVVASSVPPSSSYQSPCSATTQVTVTIGPGRDDVTLYSFDFIHTKQLYSSTWTVNVSSGDFNTSGPCQ